MVTGFLITARLKSTRLPKKIILEVAGKPLMVHMLDRIKNARRIDKIVICTSTNPQDDPLEYIAAKEGVHCYRGSEEDVLMRLYEAALQLKLDYIVNLTADCPLIDPIFIDKIVEIYEKRSCDFIRMTQLPIGQGPNGIKVKALKKVCLAKKEHDTEVWANYFIKSKEFAYYDAEIGEEYKCEGLKTSIDYPEDYEFLKRIFSELSIPGRGFSLAQIIRLVNEKPELMKINTHCIQLGREHIQRSPSGICGNRSDVKCDQVTT